MTSSASPGGPWEPLVSLLPEPGWDDCSVMWDEDGQACFVGTHFADGYKTYLFKMAADGRSIDRKSAVLVNSGNRREANKLIKVGDWYYLVFSEHRPGVGRYVMARRSRSMWGPYEEERQLALASREAMEPNQGGIVRGRDGNWYFVTHHGTGDWSGRIVSLLPVTWIDGWPIIGKVLPQGVGTMQWGGKMPFRSEEKLVIKRSDGFDTVTLNTQWQWNHQPREGFYSLTERPGWMRLKAFRPLEVDNLLTAGNTLTQRTFRESRNEVVVKMDISHMADGQKSGLCHFSSRHSAIGVVKEEGVCRLEYRQNGLKIQGVQIDLPLIWFRTQWNLDGKASYAYSLDGEHFVPFGDCYQMVWGHYRGDRVGIYCFNDKEERGWVDVDYLVYNQESECER